MKFIPVHPSAAETCFLLHQSSQYNPWSVTVFMDCLRPPYFAYQLTSKDKLFGYYIGLQVLDEITLMDISVVPALQGKGWGKRLLGDFLQQCKVRAGKEVWLEVRETNEPAIRLYQANDFELIEKRKGYYQTARGTETALIMRLLLP